jgi:hypothetical protein
MHLVATTGHAASWYKNPTPEAQGGLTVCVEKLRLLKIYEKAAALFSQRVNTLSCDVGKASKADYDTLVTAAEEGRQRAEVARQVLDHHVKTHRC